MKIKVKNQVKNWLQPVLVVLLIVAAFAIGSMWTELKTLKSGNPPVGGASPTPQAQQQPAQPKVTLNQVKELFKKDLIKFGDENKKVLLVEISDPSCPYCQAAAGKNPELNRQMDPTNNRFKLTTDGGTYQAPGPEMKKLVDSGKASMVYLYSPGHGNGEMAMKALYCAFEEGKFWEVHDLLMTNAGYNLINNVVKNDKTQTQKLADFLKAAVNSVKLKECLDSGKYDARITSDTELAASLVGGGTPNFIVNDKPILGAQPYSAFKEVIDAALK